MKKSVWIVAAVLPLLLAGCGDEGAEDLGAVSGKAVTAAPTDLPTEMPSAPAPAPSLSAPPSPSAPTDPDDAENTEIKRVEAPDDIDCPKIVAADAAPLTGTATSGSEVRSEETTSDVQSLMRISCDAYCSKKKEKQPKSNN